MFYAIRKKYFYFLNSFPKLNFGAFWRLIGLRHFRLILFQILKAFYAVKCVLSAFIFFVCKFHIKKDSASLLMIRKFHKYKERQCLIVDDTPVAYKMHLSLVFAFHTDFTIMTAIRSDKLRNPTYNRSADFTLVSDSGPLGFLLKIFFMLHVFLLFSPFKTFITIK